MEENLLAIDAPLNVLELMKRLNAEMSALSRQNAILRNENLILKNKESMLERENELFSNKINILKNELLLATRKIESANKDIKLDVADEIDLKSSGIECKKQIICSATAGLKSPNVSTPKD